MPRHELVSPEEDLAAFYGGAPPTPPGAAPASATPPPIPTAAAPASATPPPTPSAAAPASATPPPIPSAAAASPATPPIPSASPTTPPPIPATYDPAFDLAFASDPAVRRLAPVTRPPPNFTVPPEPPAAPKPNVAVATLLSVLLPGVGQMYAGQTVKGLVLLLLALFTCFGGGIFNVVAALDAFAIAQRRERGETVGEWQFF